MKIAPQEICLIQSSQTGTTSKECEVKQSRWKEEDAQHGQLIIWTETTSTRGNVVPPMLKTNFRLLIFKQWRSGAVLSSCKRFVFSQPLNTIFFCTQYLIDNNYHIYNDHLENFQHVQHFQCINIAYKLWQIV